MRQMYRKGNSCTLIGMLTVPSFGKPYEDMEAPPRSHLNYNMIQQSHTEYVFKRNETKCLKDISALSHVHYGIIHDSHNMETT